MKVKKRLAGILLIFTLVLGLIPGMSMLTYADPTITWDPAEGGSVQQFTTDAYIICFAVANQGYKFGYWSRQGSGSTPMPVNGNPDPRIYQISKQFNGTLTAHFQQAAPTTYWDETAEPAQEGKVPGKSSLTTDLKLGSQGTEVLALQQRLAALGYYNGGVDGDFGRVTDAAVKAFQRANGLYVDGVVGPLTRQALGYTAPSSGERTAPSSNDSLVLGSAGEVVLSLQQTLRALGYNVGALDGYFGPYTETAVKAFQRDNGLYVDGVVGPYTWAALGGVSAYVAPAEEAVAPQTAPNNADLVYGMTSDEIAYIQLILNLLGYDVGVIDGYFGDVTLEAVKAFQRDFGLYVDGIIGAQTKAALGIQ